MADPWPHTLRELQWRAEALNRERWDHTARLAFGMARGPLRGRLRLSDFHPFLAREDQPAAWDAWRRNAARRLPAHLSEPEITARWAKWSER